MKLSITHIQEIDSQIRLCLAQNPRASTRSLAAVLGHDKNFISKRLRKIRGERLNRFRDRYLTEELSQLEDLTQLITAIGLNIAYTDHHSTKERLLSLRTILWAHLQLFDRKMMSGLLISPSNGNNHSMDFKNILRLVHSKMQNEVVVPSL